MPKPRAKSKPRKKAVKKTAVKKTASRAIKLQRGGSFTGPSNPRTDVPGHYPMQGRTQGWYPGANPGRPPVNPNRDQMIDRFNSRLAQSQRDLDARLAASTTPPRRPPPSIRPGYQRGGSFTGPSNPNVNTPPDWGWQAQRGAQQRAYDAYMRRHPKDGPFAGQMPASMTNRNPQMERDRLAAFQAQNQRDFNARLGRPTTPRRPPPKIRPGY